MRILASNPDTLGDLVLREPLYRALVAAGHELTLVVRKGVLPLVPRVAPGAAALVLPHEVYAHDLERRWDRFAGLFESAREFNPDMLLVAPYRWTLLEEKLAEALPEGVRKVGMSGHLYAGDPYAGASPPSRMRLDVVAEVREDQLEVEKNAALCAAVLGAPPAPVDPRLAADSGAIAGAAQVLGRLGLEAGGYWVACVGGTAHVAIKTWQAENWGRVLGEWAKRYGRRFLFVGLPEEDPAARDVLRGMGEVLGSDETAARHARLWMPPDSSLDELLALTQLSAGYVGHDTGPMHVAAAMGKPTLAVFGGGTWPRFRPAVEPSVALLVGVPCVGCGWSCSFEQPYCIKAVPADAVLRAVADLEEGRVVGREARVLEPGDALERRMILEGARFAQRQVREKAELAVRLQGSYRERQAEVAALHEARAREGAQYAAAEAARAAEAEQLRAALDATREEARRAAEAESSRQAEVQRLVATLEQRTGELDRIRGEIRGIVERSGRADGNGFHEPAASPGQPDEIARLRSFVGRLEGRVRELEPRAGRRPLRQVLVDWVIGSKHYRRRAAPALPSVTVVTAVLDEHAPHDVRATIESVLAQDYHRLEYVLVDAHTVGDRDGILGGECEGRICRVLRAPGATLAEALAGGLAEAGGDVLHVLHPGDVLEPGAARRVAEYLATRRRVQAAYSEDAIDGVAGAWKFAAPPEPTPNVYHLLGRAAPFRNGVFFRRWAYEALGPLKAQFGRAAEWEWHLRLARRFGLRRLGGNVRSIRVGGRGDGDCGEACRTDLARAREAFERTFGLAGRVRCRMIEVAHRACDGTRRRFRQPLSFPQALEQSRPLPAAEAPPFAPAQPVSPLTGRSPDRFLFATPDTTGGEVANGRRPLHHVYYDTATGTALAYPPIELERLSAMYATRHAGPDAKVVPPDPTFASPYARYRGGLLGRFGVGDILGRVPSPYWWFRQPEFDESAIAAGEAMRMLAGLVDPDDTSVRFLNVGCFDGAILDRVKGATRWKTFGTETNPAAAAAARAKGHSVWEAAPQDVPLVVPAGEPFRVVFLSNTVEHLQDPPLVLRRLRQLLEPGGLVVLNQPNLDSEHAALFGPTWGRWELPYHRTLTGRRGLRRTAFLCDMKVVRTRTRTHPYPTCVSVQLNDLGLGAVVPDTARFPNDVASRGVRLTGWSRLLWDWRGKGDFLYAVLKAL